MTIESVLGIIGLLTLATGGYGLVLRRLGEIKGTLDAMIKAAEMHEQEHVRIWQRLDLHSTQIAAIGRTGHY